MKSGNCHVWKALFDEHATCPQCRIAAATCDLNMDDPCKICWSWIPEMWRKLCGSGAARAIATSLDI